MWVCVCVCGSKCPHSGTYGAVAVVEVQVDVLHRTCLIEHAGHALQHRRGGLKARQAKEQRISQGTDICGGC